MRRERALCILTSLALASCGGHSADETSQPRETDPAIAGALCGEIMTNPDLSHQNPASAAGALPSISGALPPLDDSPGASRAAREEALALLGGSGSVREAPAPRAIAPGGSTGALLTAAARPGTNTQCVEKLGYTMRWAARMPEPFPVYPRANVQEASGIEDDRCNLRIINFTTPVGISDVLDFYFTRAEAAGFRSDRVNQQGDEVLGGTRGKASYILHARKLPGGRSEVDLVTSGG